MHHVERNLLADQAAQQHGQVAQGFADIEHLGAQRLFARKCQQMPYQARRPIGILFDLHDVAE